MRCIISPMKRRFIFYLAATVLFFVLFTPTGAKTAYALDFPYIVIGDNVWLLDRTSGNRLFLLPSTYYARVDDIDEEYYYVTFNGVSGKVDRMSVSTIGYHTEAAGTMREIRIDLKYSYFTEIKLKSSLDGGVDYPVPVSASLVFLGKYPTDTDLWYYVKYNEYCGYVKAEFTSDPDITIAPFVPEEKPGIPDAEPTGSDKKDNSDLIKILVITGLSVAMIVLLIIIFRPRKKGVNKYYYEDTGG